VTVSKVVVFAINTILFGEGKSTPLVVAIIVIIDLLRFFFLCTSGLPLHKWIHLSRTCTGQSVPLFDWCWCQRKFSHKLHHRGPSPLCGESSFPKKKGPSSKQKNNNVAYHLWLAPHDGYHNAVVPPRCGLAVYVAFAVRRRWNNSGYFCAAGVTNAFPSGRGWLSASWDRIPATDLTDGWY
jgi:hypothetical protein